MKKASALMTGIRWGSIYCGRGVGRALRHRIERHKNEIILKEEYLVYLKE